MESENIKRSASVKTPKPTPITTTVEGTSVTPRQRPKGQTVSTGPISLSGQIVGQISGQGNQTQTTPANSISYVQVRLINCTRYLCLKYTKCLNIIDKCSINVIVLSGITTCLHPQSKCSLRSVARAAVAIQSVAEPDD